MKRILLSSFIALIFTVIVGSNVVKADDNVVASSGNYAVINVMEIMNQSTAVNDIKKQVDIYKASLQKQAEVEQNKLKQNEQDLIKKQGDMAPKDFEKAKADFQNTVQNTQKSFYDKSASLDKVSSDALNVVQQKVGAILAKIAKDNKYDVVYQSNALAYYPNNKDVTKQVVSELNKSLTKVQVKKPF
ncbi:OmpH family outer membrane protein [Rickettsiales bacterium LUAb2]